MKYEGMNGSFTTAFQWNYFTNHLHVSTIQTPEPVINKAFMNESGKNLLHGFTAGNYVSQKHFTGHDYKKTDKRDFARCRKLHKYFSGQRLENVVFGNNMIVPAFIFRQHRSIFFIHKSAQLFYRSIKTYYGK